MHRGGNKISLWDRKTKKLLRKHRCQSTIAEFDFSRDGNYLIVRDENSFVKVVDLKVTEKFYEYFDNYFEQLTDEERKSIGIDW